MNVRLNFNPFKILLVVFSAIIFLSVFFLISCNSENNSHTSRIKQEMKFNLFIIDKNEMNFGVSLNKPKNADFYINSNFFKSNKKPIGLVVIGRKRYSKREKNGGYFYVLDGKSKVSSRYCPTMTDYASQTIIWAIDNGIINEYFINRKLSQKKVYRTLMGEDKNGKIIILASNIFGLVTAKEIIDYARNLDITEGIMFDGGTSVDYKFSDGLKEVVFNSIPSTIKYILNIGNPTTYIYGNYKSKIQ